MKLKILLRYFAIMAAALITILAVSAFFLLNRANQQLDEVVIEATLIKDAFSDARFEIVQIQQFITDSAATGEQDGVEEATQRLQAAKKALKQVQEHSIGLAPELGPQTQKIASSAQELFDTGAKMAVAYLAGRDEGNAVMKSRGGFDDQAAALTSMIDKENVKIDAIRTAALAALDDDLESALRIILPLSVVILALVIVGVSWLRRSIFASLGADPREATEMAEQLAAGNLSFNLARFRIMPGSTFASLLIMRSRWTDLATGLRGQASLLSGQSQSMATQSHELSLSCEQQIGAVRGISDSMKHFRAVAGHVADDVQATTTIVDTVGRQAQDNVEIVSQVKTEIQQLSSAIEESSSRIAELDARAADIASIVTEIRSIAEQTNLLALNAAIEAARAGESGRGFAVVADEVRNLAGRTSSSTTDITKKIAEVHDSTKHIVTSIRRAVEQVGAGVTLAGQAADAMAEIRQASLMANEQVQRIERAVAGQAQQVDVMQEHVEQIESAAGKNANAAERVSKSSVELSELAQMITRDVGFFKLANERETSRDATLF